MKEIKFMDLDFLVTKEVFTPRPETELLVNAALFAMWSPERGKHTLDVLDIGTGTGNVAISLTKLSGNCRLVTLDIKTDALELAKKNAVANGVFDRIDFLELDIFDDRSIRQLGEFDIIVSNPPYVPRWEMPTLSEAVREEPRAALDGGEDGMDFYRRICLMAPGHLKKGGSLIVETGYNQLGIVKKMLSSAGFVDIDIFRDSSGVDRVVKARFNNG